MDRIEKAILTIYNASQPIEKIDFTIPTAEVEIGKKKDGTDGAEPIQNLGGKTTYLRRYLMMIAFEVIESDTVEQIKRNLTDEMTDEDIELINNCGDFKSLTVVCGSLKEKYNVTRFVVGCQWFWLQCNVLECRPNGMRIVSNVSVLQVILQPQQ